MTVLVDTQVLVWSQVDRRRLSRAAHSALQRASQRGGLAISAFTLYELGNLIERGKINYHGTIDETIRRLIEGCAVRPVSAEVAIVASQFPPDFPRDPGDRIIAATARVENLPLVTADRRIQGSKLIRTIW